MPRSLLTYPIPAGTPAAPCRGCGAVVYYVKTPKGATMPVAVGALLDTALPPTATEDGLGYPHWADCPKAPQFRGRK